MIAQGRRPRARQAAPPRPLELALHMQTADLLRRFAWSDWRWTHIPAGEVRDLRTASKLKRMGTKPGWPDFVFIPPTGRLHCLKLMRRGETLSEAQEDFRVWCVRHAIPDAVARSLDEALAVFNEWGCLTIKIAGGAP